MRHSCRFHFLLITWAVLFFASAIPMRALGRNTDALPKAWNDAATELADKVAAMVSPAHPVNFEMVNASDLGAASADAARGALEGQLALHHFRITRAANADTALRATLAESSESYVWTVEIRPKDAGDSLPQVAIVAVGKSALPTEGTVGVTVTLKSQLVWKQPKRFLDFRTVGAAGADQSLLFVLQPSRVDVYEFRNSQLELQSKVAISHSKPWPRDVRGYLKGSDDKIAFAMPGISCAQSIASVPSIQCEAGGEELTVAETSTPGIDTGDSVDAGLHCGDARVVIASGVGDWTQADSLQGYLVPVKQTAASGAASGAPLGFDGPVVSLVPDTPGSDAARAVVRNLKTGNYEGYLVTASCSQ